MLIFHLHFDASGSGHLWAEDSTLYEIDRPVDSSSDGGFHPFCADGETLCGHIVEMLPILDLRDFRADRIQLTLPTTAFGPAPSPHLVGNTERDVGEPAPWEVSTLSTRGLALLDVLDAFADAPASISVGESFRYWRVASGLADEWVQGGRVLPGVDNDGQRPRAVWRGRPSTAGDFSRLQRLGDAMPPVLRAITAAPGDGDGAITNPSSRDVLSTALDAFADALCRERLAESASVSSGDDDPARRWLAALTTSVGHFDAPDPDLPELETALDEWTGTAAQEDSGVRLCFRLHPPLTDSTDESSDDVDKISISEGSWRLEFLLQASDEPTLLVDAATVWESTGKTRKLLDQRLEYPQEKLLQELGRALQLFAPLKRALNRSKPDSMELSATEAHRFLRESSPLLERSRFGIILPDWWMDPTGRLGIKLRARSKDRQDVDPAVASVSIMDLMDFQWQVALGDETLSRSDLEHLAQLKMPLVRVGGRWVSVNSEDIERGLALLDDGVPSPSITDVLRAGAGLDDNGPGGLPVVDAEFDGILEELFDSDVDDRLDAATTPPGFQGELRDYQKRGLAWLAFLEDLGFGACLADDMGLGKTIQVLARLLAERHDHPDPGPTLVVAPLSVVGNWRNEAQEFAPELNVCVHHGSDRVCRENLSDLVAEHDLVITTYGVVRNDIEAMGEIRWHRVVLDEAQKIKNSTAQRTRAIRRLDTHHRLALTGTPVENRLAELWSIMEFLNPGLMGSEKSFRRNIARPVEQRGDERKTRILRRLTGPFILRRLKTDSSIISDLPDKIEIREWCHLSEEQVTLYKAATDKLLGHLENADGMQYRGLVLKLIGQLKAICNHPRQFHSGDGAIRGRAGKLERLEELAAHILEAGDRALIFSQYPTMARLIGHRLEDRFGRPTLLLDGQTPQKRRQQMIDEFQSHDGPPFFLLSLRAAGTGLTLTAANHVIHYDRWWNPAVEDQATDRTYRIGQTDDVMVHKLICKGTIEEAIDRTIERKRDLADSVLSDGDDWLTELSTDEIRKMVTLSDEHF